MTHEEFVQSVMAELVGKSLSLNEIQETLHRRLKNIDLREESQELIPVDDDKRASQVRHYLACKAVEGCADGTIRNYAHEIQYFMMRVSKPFEEVTTDDIRYYLATQRSKGICASTQNNKRLALSTFFAWLFANGITSGNPMLAVKKIKEEKLFKKPFTEVEMEWLRVGCQGNLRDTAILETLASTGCRVSELVGMDRSDLHEDEIIVYGKGHKERRAYINARAKVALTRYLATRKDSNPALFVTLLSPYDRLKISGVEIMLRKLGETCGIENTHPHRFRRTAATKALERGMPIEVVKDMLGHDSINTTLIYAKIADGAVKQAHKRLM